MKVYEEYEIRQFQEEEEEEERREEKISRDLARENIPDKTLCIMWQDTYYVRAVVAVTEVKTLKNLATIAD